MKRFLLLALCALFACQAEARTIYVNAKRPNNKGNGLSAKKAKKTLQAAINAAKAGDTIIVAPGVYSPIKTKNKKIKIKAKNGAAKTSIRYNGAGSSVAELGLAWKITYSWKGYYGSDGVWVPPGSYSYSSSPETKGTKTSVSGFALDGGNNGPSIGVSGGSLQSCIVRNVTGWSGTVIRSKLTRCTISDNTHFQISNSTLDCCKVLNNANEPGNDYSPSESSTFANCLFACNETTPFKSCTFANCTVADNTKFTMSKSKAWNTVFQGVPASQFKKSKKNTLQNCYKGSNPKFVSTKTTRTRWVADDTSYNSRTVGAKVYWEGFSGANMYWEFYDDGTGDWEDGYVTVSGTTEAEVVAAAKAKVGKPDASYWVEDYIYDDGYVTVSGTTDSAILAAAKAKVGKPNATYSIYEYTEEWGDYQTETLPGNYHLKAGSPCINKGTKVAAAKKLYGKKDLDGKKRVKGKSVDIGCYER